MDKHFLKPLRFPPYPIFKFTIILSFFFVFMSLLIIL